VAGLFGHDWERRQIDAYLDRHSEPPDDG